MLSVQKTAGPPTALASAGLPAPRLADAPNPSVTALAAADADADAGAAAHAHADAVAAGADADAVAAVAHAAAVAAADAGADADAVRACVAALNDSATRDADAVLSSAVALDLTAALDTLGVGWCMHGPDGDLVRANTFGRDLFAAGPDPMVDLSGTPLLPQDHPVTVTLRTGRAVRGVVLGVRSGTTQLRWVRVDTAVVERGTGHSDRCVVTLLVDVTAETERSRESAAAAERATRLMAPVADVICRLDSRACFVDVTRSAADVLGHEPEDLFGRTLAGLVHVVGARELTRALTEARVGGQGHAVVRCRRRDGELRWMDITLRQIVGGPADDDGSDRSGELHAVLRDVHERVLAEQARRESDWRYRLLADNAGDVVCVHDPAGHFRYASPSVLTRLGYWPAELTGLALTQLVHPDDIDAVTTALTVLGAPADGEAMPDHRLTYRLRHRDGDWVWVETTWRAVTDDCGDLLEVHATSRDVSERIAGDQALAAAEESFRLAFDSASCAMARLTSDGRLQRVNDVLCAMVGRSRTELEGRPLRLLTHPDDTDPLAELADRLATGGTELRRDQRLLRRDGSTAWVDLTLTAVRAAGDQVGHLVAQLVDTTAERVLAEQLRGLDLHDPLTTAATADLLGERLDAALEDPRRPAVALMRVDLDRFRQLNDVRGHVAADRVLVVTVQRLRTAARETDLVARLGGDDFAVLCVGVDHAHVERLAQKVSRSLSGSIGGIGPVTASIGVATARPGDGSDDVLNRAEAALSVVKRSGGSGWAVD